MGLICSCGVIIPVPLTANGRFVFIDGTEVTGTLTYTTDACADRLELGFLMFSFVDTEGTMNNRSFSFNSTNITQVSCEILNGICIVTIEGNGFVSGELSPRPFEAQFVDRPDADVARIFINSFGTASDVEFQQGITFFC